MTFKDFCKEKANDPMENIFPKGTDAQEGLNILCDHFLGPNFYTFCSTRSQSNTEIIGAILKMYPNPKEMRKWSLYRLFKRKE